MPPTMDFTGGDGGYERRRNRLIAVIALALACLLILEFGGEPLKDRFLQTVMEIPAVAELKDVLGSETFPKAGPGRYTVLLLRLSDDDGRTPSAAVPPSSAMVKALPAVTFLPLDRAIDPKTLRSQYTLSALARYLRLTGAQAALFGSAGSAGSGKQLFLATPTAPGLQVDIYPRGGKTADEEGLIVQIALAAVREAFGRVGGVREQEKLLPIVGPALNQAAEISASGGHVREEVQALRTLAAKALDGVENINQMAHLLDFKARFEEDLLAAATKENNANAMARLQWDLGNTLFNADRARDTNSNTERAISLYQQSMRYNTKQDQPLKWAKLCLNIANCNQYLAYKENHSAYLGHALTYYRQSLDIFTKDNHPDEWGIAQHKMGVVLNDIGRNDKNTEYSRRAVVHFQNALQVRDRQKQAQQWLESSRGMAQAYRQLHTLDPSEDSLVLAENLLKEVLTHPAIINDQHQEASALNLLGLVLMDKAMPNKDINLLKAASERFIMAREKAPRALVPDDWALYNNNAAMIELELAKIGKDASLFENALANAIQSWKTMEQTRHTQARRAVLMARSALQGLKELGPQHQAQALAANEQALRAMQAWARANDISFQVFQ